MATDLAYYQKLLSNGNYKAINWDRVSDAIDKSTWEKLTEQFWLDTRIPVSNDMA
ncbi:MAG: ribonucleotide-diphosphate reductase subunit beta, partial [Lactiplantibacillus plantarum]|nr:ribonucleotide-diphosphate reductase subunit beta [Lactiplantibacillus plantarum]